MIYQNIFEFCSNLELTLFIASTPRGMGVLRKVCRHIGALFSL